MPSLGDDWKIDPLPFRVDPHMLEDLGLNLYSSLPRVLVEFVANAYDADAGSIDLSVEFELVRKQRNAMRKVWKEELESAKGCPDVLEPLETRTLPADTVITLQDDGHGMTLDELRDKFLIAGRRRRIEEKSAHSREGRALMGRKGVGKLAGFGVARIVEVVTKVQNTAFAYGIRLDFDEIIGIADTTRVSVPAFRLPDDADLGQQGTRVTLSKLVHESVKTGEESLRRNIGDHFVQIDPSDFTVRLNRKRVKPAERGLAYAWPKPEIPVDRLVTHRLSALETGQDVEFQYRLRFVEDRAALRANERGVRVYAHKRLAAAPSLLHADTNMHGFRMTDYLDGVVYADFIDSTDRDYIATDRQGLRWETPLLQPLYEFLGDEIKEACKQYQAVRDKSKRDKVLLDDFTKKLIEEAHLSQRERRLALTICGRLASFHTKGFHAPEYRENARQMVSALGKGEIFTAISRIARRTHPQLQDLAGEVARLTHAEIDQAVAGVRTRVLAIKTLKRIVEATDFRAGNNEGELHSLLKKSPWLIDPTFFEFLTSDRTGKTLFIELEKKLGIDSAVPVSRSKSSPEARESTGEDRRPDLVFLLGNENLRRLVIVELKAANTPLLHKHLLQLKDYMRDAEQFLKSKDFGGMTVEGCLIGTLDLERNMIEVKRLRGEMADRGPQTKWGVFDWVHLLNRTEAAHKEFLEVHESNWNGDED